MGFFRNVTEITLLKSFYNNVKKKEAPKKAWKLLVPSVRKRPKYIGLTRKRILSGTEEINIPIATPFKTKMTAESLKKLGLFFDELKRIRVWEPEAALKTAELKDESKDFVDKITEFHNTSSDFINLIQDLAKQVEKEKIKALGSSNVLKSMTKQRECEQQQYQSLIMEKSAELERLRAQHQSLLKVQLEQQEMIQQIQLY